MMFSLLSNWRQTFSSSDGESDDVSSLNRSLSLPWPVTESSPRKNKNEGTPTQQQQLRQQPVNGTNMRDISYPIPKMALKSLTRSDDHPAAGLLGPSAPPATIGTSSLNPFIGDPGPTLESGPRFQESTEKRRNSNLRTALLQANAYAQYASTSSVNAPPEVVRLDNNNSFPVVEAGSQPPSTVYHDTSTGHLTSYANVTHPYANGISNPGLYANQYAHQTPHDEDNEIYTSPFGHSDDDEDGFFYGPLPKQTATSIATSRWGGLKLHTASPFSQSTLRVDGLILPPPSNTSSHHTLPLPTGDGVFPPSLQPGTPPLPTVNTDVYNHAYNYPLAKQLSPIAEQDYLSPVSARGLPGSPAGASPGADSVLNLGFGFVNGRTAAEGDRDKDKDKERDWERGSIRTRSVRAGSVGSAKAPAMASVSGSGSMKEGTTTRDPNPSPSGSTIGSEIMRPSPIYASPFITRHLNRTISQTSSNKSESPSQAQFQPPPPPPPPPPLPSLPPPPVTSPESQSQPQPQGVTQCNVPSTPTLSPMTSQLSIGSITSTPRLSTATITPANAYLKSSGPNTIITTTIPTPTSAATTTTGTMYSPNSAFPAPTPTSPTATTGIQIPAPAIVILPCIPPLDFRPFFPGPHPSPNLSTDSEVPRLRPPKLVKRGDGVHRLSVIRGSGIQSDAEDVFTGDEEEVVDNEDEDGEEEGVRYDVESLHADSFVTATTNSNEDENDEQPPEREVELTDLAKGKSASVRSTRTHTSQLPSATMSHSGSGNSTTGDSFITRRWDRDAALGLSLSLSPTTFRERKHRFFSSNSSFITNLTPAFWAFWLGFLLPVLWLVGGWHFTNLGEQPPKLTIWEWYFWRMGHGRGGFVWWKKVFAGWWCLGMRKGGRSIEGFKNHKRGSSQQQQHIQSQMQQGPQRRMPLGTRPRTKSHSYSHSQLRSGKVFPALPRWVAEKQSSDDGRMRLNDPKRSLKGISFGYPFISRPPYSKESTSSSSTPASLSLSVVRRALVWIEKPNRVLDQLYGVKLYEVRGRPESGRRMFDPWVQRCRYAFCWMVLAVAIGLCTASVYLIVVNTRRL